ncbi:MAG TPA: ABC transporter permease [Aggregatilineales bacterium]|nr:ABC transporter permease [Aggregatilineales bacterium]
MNDELISTLAGVVSAAAPLLIAAQGELITERAGVVNLSLNGSILLAAMAAFAIALETNSTEMGILAAMIVGMVVALVIISANVFLSVNQIAVGFVLTLLCADLAAFLGQDYAGLPGGDIEIPYLAVPVLQDIPVIGEIFFQHNLMVYFSFVLVAVVWFWIYRTSPGLSLRALGERPSAGYVRGLKVQQMRFVYVAIGGALIGLAGAAYSLDYVLGWRETSPVDGQGWIALAIVIFGTWKPFRILLGAYLIRGLGALALYLQTQDQLDLPIHIINMVPWLLMLLTLMFVASGVADYLVVLMPESWRPAARRFLRSDPPAALGTAFEKE